MTVSIRPALKKDIDDIAYIHTEGFRDSYQHIAKPEFLNSLSVNDKVKQWNVWFQDETINILLAENEKDKILGFSSFGKLKTPPPGMSFIRPLYTSELYALYVLHDNQRTGIGTKLLKESVKTLKKQRYTSMCLWTAQKNTQANNFYKKMGGERCGKKDVMIGEKKARDICFGWRNTQFLL